MSGTLESITGKLLYGEKNAKQLEKIKQIEEIGYNVYYSILDDKIVYDLKKAKERIGKVKQNKTEMIFDALLNQYNWLDMKGLLRKNDYKERAKHENAKCLVLFLAIMKEIYGEYNCHNEERIINEAFAEFTEHEMPFYEMVEFVQKVAGANCSEAFYEACMDYLMNLVLKEGL